MGSILSADDMAKGQVVAVHSYRRRKEINMRMSENAIDSFPRVQLGSPLTIKAISLPFLACSVISPSGDEIGPAILDIRETRICHLNPEYLDALTNPENYRHNHDEED